MKIKFSLIAVLAIAVSLYSCSKEDPFLTDGAPNPSLQSRLVSSSDLLPVLSGDITDFKEDFIADSTWDSVSIAVRHLSSTTNPDVKLYLSLADFSFSPSEMIVFSTGMGLIQGSTLSEDFGLNLAGTAWGFEMLASSDMTTMSMGQAFSPAGYEKDLLTVQSSVNQNTGSYIVPLAVLADDIAGWEIFDAKHGVGMIVANIGDRYAFSIAASSQANLELAKSLLDERRIDLIRNLDPNGTGGGNRLSAAGK